MSQPRSRAVPWMSVVPLAVAAAWVVACGGDGGGTVDPVDHVLTVSVTGSGEGTVTSQPGGIACSSDGGVCTASFGEVSTVTLTATPADGSVFAGWSGSCSGTGACAVQMTGARSVTATFVPPAIHTLSVTLSGDGTGSVTSQPAGVDCASGDGSCDADFAEGTSVTLTATPDADMTFAGWSGACSGAGGCTVAIGGDRAVDAAFDDPALESAEIGPAGGAVTSSDGRLTITVPAGALATTESITIADLDPASLSEAVPGVEVLRAYEVGPDGLAFALPVLAELLTDREAAVADGTVSMEVDVLASMENGDPVVLAESGARVEEEGTITLFGEMEHFSPVYEVRLPGSMGILTVTVSGIPEESTVGTSETLTYEVTTGGALDFALVNDGSSDLGFFPLEPPGTTLTVVDEHQHVVDRVMRCTRVDAEAHFLLGFGVKLAGQQPPEVPVWFAGKSFRAQPELIFVPCVASSTPVIETGYYAAVDIVAQLYGLVNLGGQLAELESGAGLLATSGEDAEGNGLVVVFDPVTRALMLRRALSFYAFGLVGAVADPVGAAVHALLFAWGQAGFALFTTQSPFGEEPSESGDTRIDDAVQVGGGTASEAVVFASREVGVGFVRFDEALGRFSVSDEILDDGLFVGDVISAYAHTPDGPVVVLARSSSSRLYFHPRDGGSPTVAVSGLGSVVQGMRCLPPVCLVPHAGSTDLRVILFDGATAPSRTGDVALDFVPETSALRLLGNGNVGAVLIGRSGGTPTVVEIELEPDGGLVRTVPVTVPGACLTLGRVAYVPDGLGHVLVVSCVGSNGYFVERSALD